MVRGGGKMLLFPSLQRQKNAHNLDFYYKSTPLSPKADYALFQMKQRARFIKWEKRVFSLIISFQMLQSTRNSPDSPDMSGQF